MTKENRTESEFKKDVQSCFQNAAKYGKRVDFRIAYPDGSIFENIISGWNYPASFSTNATSMRASRYFSERRNELVDWNNYLNARGYNSELKEDIQYVYDMCYHEFFFRLNVEGFNDSYLYCILSDNGFSESEARAFDKVTLLKRDDCFAFFWPENSKKGKIWDSSFIYYSINSLISECVPELAPRAGKHWRGHDLKDANESERERLAARVINAIKKEDERYSIRVWRTGGAIKRQYQKCDKISGLQSCMTKRDEQYYTRVNPTIAYGRSDVSLVTLRDNKEKKTVARVLIDKDEKSFCRIYHTGAQYKQKLIEILTRLGFDEGGLTGSYIQKIEKNGYILTPYSDSSEGYIDDGDSLRLSDEKYDMSAHLISGGDRINSRYRCSECGVHVGDNGIENSGNMYCESCFDESFAACDSCGEDTERCDMTRVGDDSICSYCVSSRTSECSACGERFYNSDMQTIESDDICNGCFESAHESGDIMPCDHCGESFYTDNLTAGTDKNGAAIHVCAGCESSARETGEFMGPAPSYVADSRQHEMTI